MLKSRCIALTGGVATGKSTVAQILSQLGVTVIDADQISRMVTAKNGRAHRGLIETFGKEILAPDGDIDRAKLRQIILHSAELKLALEKIVHPAIWQELERIVEQFFLTNKETFIYEVTLIHETGNAHLFKETWCTHLDRALQTRRLAERWSYSQEQAEAFVALQKDNSWRAGISDKVISTTGTFDDVQSQVEELWSKSRRN